MSIIKPADQDVETAVLAVEARRIQALIDGDVKTLDELFDDSLVHIHAPGLTHSKAQLLEHVATRHAYKSITRGRLNIRVAGQVAIVTGSISNLLLTANGGERIVDGVATQVLVRDGDGTWRYVSFQMTPTGEQAWPPLPSEQPSPQQEQERL